MKNLAKVIKVVAANKPAFKEPCNNCGWCCLTEVCPIGVEITGSDVIPCSLLKTEGDKHTCSVANIPSIKMLLGINTGCCAITQEEKLAELRNKNATTLQK